jgi:hypothetical protein
MTNHSLYSTKFKEKQRLKGLCRLQLWVPADQQAAIKAMVNEYIEKTLKPSPEAR